MSFNFVICKYCFLGIPKFLFGLEEFFLNAEKGESLLLLPGADVPYKSLYNSFTTLVLDVSNKFPFGPYLLDLLESCVDLKDLAAKAIMTIQKKAGTP